MNDNNNQQNDEAHINDIIEFSQVSFNFMSPKFYPEQKIIQNAQKTQVIIEYFEQCQNEIEFQYLINSIKNSKEIEIIIQECSLFEFTTHSENLQNLLSYLTPLVLSDKIKIIMISDNNDNSDYTELNDFFYNNKNLKVFEFSIEGSYRNLTLKYQRNSMNSDEYCSLNVLNKGVLISNKYFTNLQNNVLKELIINLAAFNISQYQKIGEIQKYLPQLLILSLTISNSQRLPIDIQADLVNNLHMCQMIESLSIVLHFKVCNQFIQSLGKNLQLMYTIKELFLIMDVEIEESDQSQFKELQEGIQNQTQLETLKSSQVCFINQDVLNNLKCLKILDINNTQKLNKQEIEIIDYRNIRNDCISLSKQINLKILKLVIPLNIQLSLKGQAMLYNSFKTLHKLEQLSMSYKPHEEESDYSPIFFGDNLKYCTSLEKIEIIYDNLTCLPEQDIIQFGESLANLKDLVNIQIKLNTTQTSSQILFYYLNQVVKNNFYNSYDLQYQFNFTSKLNNLKINYEKARQPKTVLRYLIKADKMEAINSAYFDKGVLCLRNIEYLTIFALELQEQQQNMLESIKTCLELFPQLKSICIRIENSMIPIYLENIISGIEKYNSCSQFIIELINNTFENKSIITTLDSLKTQNQLTSLQIKVLSQFIVEKDFYINFSDIIKNMVSLKHLSLSMCSGKLNKTPLYIETLFQTIQNLPNMYNLFLALGDIQTHENLGQIMKNLNFLSNIVDFKYFLGIWVINRKIFRQNLIRRMKRIVQFKDSLSQQIAFYSNEHIYN